MSKAGKTFYLASRLLPTSVRSDVVNLYGFCRTVDDLADDCFSSLSERRRKLQWLQQSLQNQGAAQHRLTAWPFPSEGVLPQAAATLVHAALQDLEQQQPETEEQVLAYAFGVAGTVGIMMAEVLRASPRGRGAAVALGMAMQLSNICRDVAEDLRMGRVYLPARWVTADAIRRAIDQGDAIARTQLEEATTRLLVMANHLYEVAYNGIWSLPWRVRWAILAAALCYREIGVQVGLDVRRSWRTRVVVSRGRKLWLLALAGVRLLRPRFWLSRRTTWSPALGRTALQACSDLGVVA